MAERRKVSNRRWMGERDMSEGQRGITRVG